MLTAKPGDVCPQTGQTGTWCPGKNPNFYPKEYADRVMNRPFNAGSVMPPTPHGEPYWALRENGKPVQNFTGMSTAEILDAVRDT